MSQYLVKSMVITWKDILHELRTKDVLTSVVVFALVVIFIFNFAFEPGSQAQAEVAPGILWVAFTFAGVLSLGRSMIMEQDRGCLEGLMLCPVDRSVIYLGKMLGSLIFVTVMEVVAFPVFAVLFNLPLLVLTLVPVMVLGTLGFVAVGTLFSTIAINTKAREVMLPLLFFPVVIPVIISTVKATGLILGGGPWADIQPWLSLLVSFDLIFLVVCFLTFEYVLEE